MKPTPEQVVAHFDLPAEAVGSQEIRVAIDNVPDVIWKSSHEFYLMGAIEWSFVQKYNCPIADYFKPNDGKD